MKSRFPGQEQFNFHKHKTLPILIKLHLPLRNLTIKVIACSLLTLISSSILRVSEKSYLRGSTKLVLSSLESVLSRGIRLKLEKRKGMHFHRFAIGARVVSSSPESKRRKSRRLVTVRVENNCIPFFSSPFCSVPFYFSSFVNRRPKELDGGWRRK